MNSEIKERPIVFGPIVRAILDGSKTQVRKPVRNSGDMEFDNNDSHFGPYWEPYAAGDATGEDAKVRCPCGIPGERLWVRETWGVFSDLGFSDTSWAGIKELPDGWSLAYRADHVDPVNGDGPHIPFWRPPIHMPRWASRILLEIVDVRVERVQEISDEDAWAEGCEPSDCNPVEWFRYVWESDNGASSWDANPWVWAISFQRLKP